MEIYQLVRYDYYFYSNLLLVYLILPYRSFASFFLIISLNFFLLSFLSTNCFGLINKVLSWIFNKISCLCFNIHHHVVFMLILLNITVNRWSHTICNNSISAHKHCYLTYFSLPYLFTFFRNLNHPTFGLFSSNMLLIYLQNIL